MAVLTIPATHGCMTLKPVPVYSLQETLDLAPVAVYVKCLYDRMSLAVFQVLDVYKGVAGGTLMINEGNVRTSCDGTPFFRKGEKYILALNHEGESEVLFTLAEPGLMATAAFEPTPENLEIASNMI